MNKKKDRVFAVLRNCWLKQKLQYWHDFSCLKSFWSFLH